MGTISDKLTYLQGTKSAIKNAIVAKGVDVPTGTPFRDYATKIGEISGGGGTPVADEWVRPSEWLPLPDNIDGVEKVSILNAVFDTDSEFVAFICKGAYTVDWGDGVVENYNSSAKAEHKYDYSNVNLNSDTVSKFGYKQCVITITPQSGQNLTLINFNTFHSTIGANTNYDLASGFLDMRVNSLSCSSLDISGSPDYIKHSKLQQCLIGELMDSTLSYLFIFCSSLQSVSIKDTSNVIHFNGMHQINYSLRKVPQYDYSKAITMASMFSHCSAIREFPNFNTTTSLLHLNSTFINCNSLEVAPIFSDTSKVTDISSMLSGCKNLTNVPNYVFGEVSSGSDIRNFFYNCDSLQICPNITVGTLYTSNTNFLFNNYSLKRMLMPLRFTFSVANAKMSANALNEMFSILPTVTGQTVTITGNYGASTCDTSIATAKGWTVIK